jgi:protein-tyrosine-phosphatase/predicted ATP-grasp superfamily ATP-dependent carboligase
MTRKVLVLGCDNRSGLAVVRSLGRQEIEVHTAWCLPDSTAPFSRYNTETHDLPPYGEAGTRWLAALIDLVEREKFDLVMPTTDISILPLVKERAALEKAAKLAIPSDRAFYCAYRKNETAELAQSLNVPVPRQILVSDRNSITEFDAGWKFPLVIKPISSKIVRGNELISLHVSYANSKEELFAELNSLLEYTHVLIQEYFVGTGMGIELLSNEGQILCAFQHVRVHEPLRGGGSSYRKSVPLNLKLVACAQRLILALKWTGVAMLEFRYNKLTDEFVLVEINPRFWGSLPLAIAAIMDFPYYLYQLLVDGKTTFPTKYKAEIYCRNMRLDLAWLLANLRTRPSKFNNALPLWKVAGELFNIALFRERSDAFVLDDLRPGFRELALIFEKAFTKLQHFVFSWLFRLSLVHNIQNKRITLYARKPCLNICFVCKGNICRSPFAESYLKKVCVQKKLEVEVESTGYHPQASRRCPAEAVRAAHGFEVDLSGHRSSVLCEQHLSQNDLVFVFDIENWALLRQKFTRYKSKVFLLGSLGDNSRAQIISDPYGQDEKAFAKTYSRMAALLNSLAKAMAHD